MTRPIDAPSPVLPDYGGACLANLLEYLLDPDRELPGWVPGPLAGAEQVVFLLVDGLGWEQLQERRSLAPRLASLSGGPITTVCPTTTATALTSATTGLPPGEHGLVGYRVLVRGEVLNTLRWSTGRGDARERIPPSDLQPHPAFGGSCPSVVTRTEFATTGFTEAHLEPVRMVGYRMTSTLAVEVDRLLGAGEQLVYAYYDGIDKVAHEYGLGAHYDAELASVDSLVGTILDGLPVGATLVVTADHGQVDVGDNVLRLPPEVLRWVGGMSGEGRFRWLHARAGHAEELLAAARDEFGHLAWVVTRDEVCDGGWFGPRVDDRTRGLLGDVALVPWEAVAFEDPADTGPFVLKSRHGSMTSAEVMVPLLAAAGGDDRH